MQYNDDPGQTGKLIAPVQSFKQTHIDTASMKSPSQMKIKERHSAILGLVKEHKKITVEQLAEQLSASRETIRRDLSEMSAQGQLKKYHGGAMVANEPMEQEFRKRRLEQAEEKRRIGRTAAALFGAGDTLLIDTGTTTIAFAQELAYRTGFTVVTNSLTITQLLGKNGAGNKVFLIGGEYLPDASQNVGRLAVEQIMQFTATDAVITVGAIDEQGVMDYELQEAEIAKAMISQARRLTVIADASKFNRTALFRVCGLEQIHRLVVDKQPDPALSAALLAANVEVHIAI